MYTLLRMDEFCKKHHLKKKDSSCFDNLFDALQCIYSDTMTCEYLQRIVCTYVKERFHTSSLRGCFFADETIESITKKILYHKIVNDHVLLQSVSTQLEAEIHLLSMSGDEFVHLMYPYKEPEVQYHCSRQLFIFKNKGMSMCLYQPMERYYCDFPMDDSRS